MPGPRIVNRDPGGGAKARAQYFGSLGEESVLLFAQQAHDLPLGNIDPQVRKQCGQARDRDLPLMVLAEEEALEVGAKMAGGTLWQCGHNRIPGRKRPALAPVQNRPRLDDQILDDEVLVPFEPGALRQAVRLQNAGLVNGELCALGAAPPLFPAILGGGSLYRLLHAAGLELGAALQALEPCDLLAQLRVFCLEPGILFQSLHQQRRQLFEAKLGNVQGRFGHAQRES